MRIAADGTVTGLLAIADDLQNPTSVAVRGGTAYVLSAAYTTQTDPNLTPATLGSLITSPSRLGLPDTPLSSENVRTQATHG